MVYLAMTQGLDTEGGRAVPWAIIGRALQDMAANGGQPWSAQTLRVFCAKLMRPAVVAGGRRTPEPAPAGGPVRGKRLDG